MSKLMSEEQLFDAFEQQMKTSKYRLDRGANEYIWPETRDAFRGFKAAFTLLMPIIEKQMEALESTWPGEFGAIIRAHHDEFIQETKQMLEKLLEEVK